MSIERSPNCSAYTDTVSTLIDASATVPGDPACIAKTVSFSCQKSGFEKPDKVTNVFLTEKLTDELTDLGCDVSLMKTSFKTNLVGSRHTEYNAEELASLGMSSNCFAGGNDPNQATHKITASCKPQYDMLDENGNSVRNFTMTFNSELAACDVSEEAMPQLKEDARKMAQYIASKNGYTVEKPEHLACSFSILPHL